MIAGKVLRGSFFFSRSLLSQDRSNRFFFLNICLHVHIIILRKLQLFTPPSHLHCHGSVCGRAVQQRHQAPADPNKDGFSGGSFGGYIRMKTHNTPGYFIISAASALTLFWPAALRRVESFLSQVRFSMPFFQARGLAAGMEKNCPLPDGSWFNYLQHETFSPQRLIWATADSSRERVQQQTGQIAFWLVMLHLRQIWDIRAGQYNDLLHTVRKLRYVFFSIEVVTPLCYCLKRFCTISGF